MMLKDSHSNLYKSGIGYMNGIWPQPGRKSRSWQSRGKHWHRASPEPIALVIFVQQSFWFEVKIWPGKELQRRHRARGARKAQVHSHQLLLRIRKNKQPIIIKVSPLPSPSFSSSWSRRGDGLGRAEPFTEISICTHVAFLLTTHAQPALFLSDAICLVLVWFHLVWFWFGLEG